MPDSSQPLPNTRSSGRCDAMIRESVAQFVDVSGADFLHAAAAAPRQVLARQWAIRRLRPAGLSVGPARSVDCQKQVSEHSPAAGPSANAERNCSSSCGSWSNTSRCVAADRNSERERKRFVPHACEQRLAPSASPANRSAGKRVLQEQLDDIDRRVRDLTRDREQIEDAS